ncbi:hypothetical protein WJX75_009668 [Coccomyxa subellipsoidea]|uniref:Uncharacterized protein n=1 Tax=Coccomyxa subellipsoidea TaxID=248742 RepID=A0ABR2YH28_9CHLO
MLQDLPKKGTAETMVPLGKAAFFPGQLVDTQQCLIRMGDSLHVHRTTSEAVAILQKREPEPVSGAGACTFGHRESC